MPWGRLKVQNPQRVAAIGVGSQSRGFDLLAAAGLWREATMAVWKEKGSREEATAFELKSTNPLSSPELRERKLRVSSFTSSGFGSREQGKCGHLWQ